ncbi:ABC transporter [Clostridiales bacterium PH28_bin88]|nr:ABC transporter [Clostridiales bacterium PH28_bin88]
MIQMFNVSKLYANGAKALVDASVHIHKGEFVFLVGPSGAGKSTFIRLLFREELPTRGQIMIGGRSILRLRRREIPLLRRNIGIVFQDFRLLADRTAYENVAFALEVQEADPREIKQRVPQTLEMVGLTAKHDRYPHQLSGGEQQRVAVARAIVNSPRILVADEPTGNLDPDTSWEIMQLFNEINKRGTTVIVATHNREVVNSMRKRVIALEGGHVVRDDEKGGYLREA